mgnify:CR=1 FL=1
MGKEEKRADFARAVDQTALPLLLELARFAQAKPGPLESVARRFFPFWSGPLDERRGARVVDFLMFDFRNGGYGRRAIDEFLIQRGAGLPDEARTMLTRWSDATQRLYAVERWSGGFITCSDALAGGAAIEVLPLRSEGARSEGRPVGLRALACGVAYFCTGRPLEFDVRGTDEVRAAVRARHLTYVRTKRIAGIDEFLRADPTALDEEAALGGRTSSIILPGLP